MKIAFSTLSTLIFTFLALFVGSFILVTPTPAHASILGDGFIRASISATEGNVFQNRDNRNQLLTQIQTSKQPKIVSPAERQAQLIQQLSIIISNLQNISDRITIRARAEASSGQDVSDITALLSTASANISLASSSVATSTATTTNPFDAHTAVLDAISSVNAAKNNLQQALDLLEQSSN